MTPAAFADLIARAEQLGGGHLLPVLRKAADGVLGAVFAFRNSRVSLRELKTAGRPVLLVLGDDDHHATGPTGWPDAVRMLRWARCVILHGAGGTAEHYAGAALATQVHGRVLLIETDTAHLDAWCALVIRIRPNGAGLIVRTRPGAPPHPMLHAPAGTVMQ